MSEDKNKFSGFEVGDSGVKFKEYRVEPSYHPGTSKIIQWVMKYSGGYIKDERRASYVILGFVVLAMIVSLLLFFGGDSAQPTSGNIPQDQFVPQ